jgi:spore coat protein CotH
VEEPVIALILSMLGPAPCGGRGVPEGPPDAPGGDSPGAFLYAEGTVHDFDITIDHEAEKGLGRDAPDVHATLTYRGVSWDVGFSLKGSSTFRDLGSKPSMKIDLGQWVHGQKLLGVRRLTLNAMISDASMLREHAAYHLFAELGIPAARQGYARVRVNGDPYGLYSIVESMDEQFLHREFPNDADGTLYDSHFTFADLTSGGLSHFEQAEGDPLIAGADLRELVDALDRGPILDVIDRYFDRDALLLMWASDLAAPNWDGYTRNTNNYLLYHAPRSDRWHFLPWGEDTTFHGGGTLYTGVSGRMVTACRGDHTCAGLLDAAVATVLDTWEASDLAGYAETAWTDFVSDACDADDRRELGCDGDGLLSVLRERPQQLRRELR